VSAAPPILMSMEMGVRRPIQIGREDHERELDGDDEERILGLKHEEELGERVG